MFNHTRVIEKKTLTHKLVITMTLIVAGTILFCWFLNNTFLEKIYEQHKYKELIADYELVEQAYINDYLDDSDFLLQFHKICAGDNLDIIVAKQNTVVLSSTNDRHKTIMVFYNYTHSRANSIYDTISRWYIYFQ